MDESEKTVHRGAARGEGALQSVCRQLVADEARYRFWLVRHEEPMTQVAAAKHRRDQILSLRKSAVQQVHKSALVRYFADYHITGKERDLTLADFYGVIDPRQATVAAHQTYLHSASTGFCDEELLSMVGDKGGLDLLQKYRERYGQYFSMYCGSARAKRRGNRYVLEALIPELNTTAKRLREKILGGQQMPSEVYGGVRFRRAS